MDDQTLIRLLRQDPDAGLRAAMQSYAPLVKAVIGRILPRDPREAEEAVADVFVALWRQAPALARENTPLRPWLAVTARRISSARLSPRWNRPTAIFFCANITCLNPAGRSPRRSA